MNSYEYIAEVKRTNSLDTDYKVCKMLGWSQNKVSQYKRGQSMDNEAARQIAEILDIPLLTIIADMEIMRSKTEPTRNAWLKLSKMTHQTGQSSVKVLIALPLFILSATCYILC